MVVEVNYVNEHGQVRCRTLITDGGCVVATGRTVQTILKWDGHRVQVIGVRFLPLGAKRFTELPALCVGCLDALCPCRRDLTLRSYWVRHSGSDS